MQLIEVSEVVATVVYPLEDSLNLVAVYHRLKNMRILKYLFARTTIYIQAGPFK